MDKNTQQPVAEVCRNSAGQIYMANAAGNMFDMSKYIGEKLYTAPPVPRDVLMAFGEEVHDAAINAAGDSKNPSPLYGVMNIDLAAIADRYASKVQPERCQCCGYLVTESEHKGCLRAGRAAIQPEPLEAQQPSSAQQARIAELEGAIGSALGGPYYMDHPDGGSVTLEEQLQRMAKDAARYRWCKDNPDNAASVFDNLGPAYFDSEIDMLMQK